MFLANLFRRGNAKRPTYKPSFSVLEDRTVPSGFRPGPWPAGPATHLGVEAPYSVKAGESFYVEVEALTANDRLATGYTGTVALSLVDADANATLPASYTFTSGDHGIHWFQLTLTVAQSQTIDAADTATASISGSAALTVKAAPMATSFFIEAPHYALDGGPVTVTVVALDQYHHVATGYTGTIQLTGAGVAGLPADYTFSSTDQGQLTIPVTFNTVGAETLTATDTTTSSITGQTSVNVEAANAVTHFGVYSFGSTTVGAAISVMVVALDANNHVVAGYTGTVSFQSSDSSVVLPNYQFTAADNGRHTFSVTFSAAGSQTLTVTDTVTSSITGTDDVWVSAQHHFRHSWWSWGF